MPTMTPTTKYPALDVVDDGWGTDHNGEGQIATLKPSTAWPTILPSSSPTRTPTMKPTGLCHSLPKDKLEKCSAEMELILDGQMPQCSIACSESLYHYTRSCEFVRGELGDSDVVRMLIRGCAKTGRTKLG